MSNDSIMMEVERADEAMKSVGLLINGECGGAWRCFRRSGGGTVLATVLNASLSTIQKWEIGEEHPGGPSLKLLNILDRKALAAMT